jgi:putative ABC transport system substrate-binding protein
MRRREFIALLGGAAAWPLTARAQSGERMRRIGVLSNPGPDDAEMRHLCKGCRNWGGPWDATCT